MDYNSENPLFEFDIYKDCEHYALNRYTSAKLYCFISIFRVAINFTLWTFKGEG